MSEGERRIVVEVFRSAETGHYEARALGGYRLEGDDLLCWSDAPCLTPGQALARYGEAIDADLVRDAWEMPREDLDPVLEGKQVGLGLAAPSPAQEPPPTAGEIRDRVLSAFSALEYPTSVRVRVEAATLLQTRKGTARVPHAWIAVSALDQITIDHDAFDAEVVGRNLFHVEHADRIYFFWKGLDPTTITEMSP